MNPEGAVSPCRLNESVEKANNPQSGGTCSRMLITNSCSFVLKGECLGNLANVAIKVRTFSSYKIAHESRTVPCEKYE